MTTNYAGDPASYPANVRLAADTALRNATELAAASEDLADRTANIDSRLTTVSSTLNNAVNNIPGVASAVTQYVDLYSGTTIIAAASSGFAKDQNYGRVSWVQSAGLVDGDGIAFCISPLLPKVGRISLLRVYGRGNGHSLLPAQLPWVQLCRLDRNSTASTNMTVIGTGVDASANATAFNLVHYIDCTQNLPHTLDHGYEYHVRLRGEFGANAQIGFRFSSLEIGIVQ